MHSMGSWWEADETHLSCMDRFVRGEGEPCAVLCGDSCGDRRRRHWQRRKLVVKVHRLCPRRAVHTLLVCLHPAVGGCPAKHYQRAHHQDCAAAQLAGASWVLQSLCVPPSQSRDPAASCRASQLTAGLRLRQAESGVGFGFEICAHQCFPGPAAERVQLLGVVLPRPLHLAPHDGVHARVLRAVQLHQHLVHCLPEGQ